MYVILRVGMWIEIIRARGLSFMEKVILRVGMWIEIA
ncbi:Uncharacterised protein [uncultured Megasphaera sp.]|nr:Uncharacterised protein [uncultured Megasphaera sp.]SCI89064.1 Uncharacterised protein [uncultured Ruminococcus sp.]